MKFLRVSVFVTVARWNCIDFICKYFVSTIDHNGKAILLPRTLHNRTSGATYEEFTQKNVQIADIVDCQYYTNFLGIKAFEPNLK